MKKMPNKLTASPTSVRCTKNTPAGFIFNGNQGEFIDIIVLENDLVRVRMHPKGSSQFDRTWMVLGADGEMPLEGRKRDDLSPFSLPAFQADQNSDEINLSTHDLKLHVRLGDFAITWSSSDSKPLASDKENQAYRYEKDGKQIGHSMVNQSGEYYYGFGEVSGPLNKSKSTILLKNVDNPGYSAKNGSPLYKQFPFYITYHPQTGKAFGIFYDNLATTQFNMHEKSNTRGYLAEAGDLDYYFIYGPSIREVVEKFSKLTGKMLLPPRWSLGYLGSTMTYTEAMDAQNQLAKFAQKCKQYQIPCDLFHLSSGYTLGDDGKRYVFNWNRKRVPEPKEMVSNFHNNGIRLSANIKPALLTTHPRFDEVNKLGGFIRQAEKDEPQLMEFWGGTASSLDFSNPVTTEWWKRNIKEQLLNLGIDSTWNDNNEYEVWTGESRCTGFGQSIPIELARPLQTLWMVRASYEAQLENKPNERPFLISRAGCPGMQRYVQTWSGDNYTSWQTLKYNIPMGLGLGLSGVANNGHDVGGFAGLRPTPELFLRWIQNGIFQPRFTIHSWKIDRTANEPWMYPKILPYVQEAIYFRYRLIPYLYNLMVESAATGHPINRPLVYEFPDDLHCVEESFDFMLGSSLLVASVLAPGIRNKKIYLPAGQYWYDFYSSKHFAGGSTYKVPAPLEHIPLFVREGGIIPMGNVIHPLFHKQDDLRQVLVFPHIYEGEASLILNEDDGHSLGYMRNECTKLKLNLHSSRDKLVIVIEMLQYSYQLPYREIEFILPAGESRPLELTGIQRHWADEQSKSHYIWSVPEFKG